MPTRIGAEMDIKETANDLIEQGKAALDANGDGKIEVKEVVDALAGRVKEKAGAAADAAAKTADAAKEAVDEVKKGFDADGDGKVSGDEVLGVVEAVTGKASDAVLAVGDKVADFVVRDKDKV